MTILKQRKQTTFKDSELWQFSLKFYADENNRTAFLFLQDHYQLNINIMSSLIWYAASGRGHCSSVEIQQLNDLIAPWQNLVTNELRILRKKISKDDQDLYQSVLSTEIYSEKIQHNIIYDFFMYTTKHITNATKKAKQAAINLQIYFSICKANLSEEGYKHTRYLLSKAFTEFKDYEFPQLSLEL